MRCFNCDYKKITEDMKNCPICGVSLSKKCNKCKSFNPAPAKFCFECGSMIESEIIINEEKRQKIGVIFADISGFTSLAEIFNPEETKEIINECFDVITEPVYKIGGKIDKFIGDCVMVVFGLDDEYDVPAKTIECAIEMRYKMNNYIKIKFPNKDIALNISIGATYGEVISGSVGTRHDSDHTIVGDIVNVASRLQNHASVGEILVNDLLYIETKNIALFGELKKVKLKNKSDLVDTYNVEKMLTKVDKNETYIVREEELLFRKFLDGKENNVLQIVGESGSGKTMMISKVAIDFNTIIVRQQKMDIEIPYSLIKKIISKIIGVSFDDDKDTTKKKLDSFIRYIFNNLEEEVIMKNYNFISLLLNLERGKEFDKVLHSMDYQDLENEKYEQFNFFITNANNKEKFNLFIDNSDFIDSESLHILTKTNNFTSKIVYIAKTKTLDNDESIVLSLKNFDQDQAREFTAKYFKISISKTFDKHLYELTNGNPFYLSELCKFIDSNEKTYKDDELILSEAILDGLPNTLSILHSNVFNSLDENSKKYLRVASVFMNEFDSRVIFRLINTDFEDEVEWLLLDLNIIELHSYYRYEGKTYKKFTFKNNIVKGSIYNGLVKKEQNKYHTALAKYFEEIDYNYESIAFHYEASGDIGIAKEYVYKQATQFNNAFDLDLAVKKYLKYLEFENKMNNYSVESRVVESLIEISKIMLFKSNFEETIKYINEGMEICQSDDELHQLQLLLIEYYKATANIEKIFPILEELEETLQKTSRNYGKLLQLKCTIYNMIGKPGVIELADKSKEILLRAKDYDSLAETLTQAGIRYFIQGDISNGISYLESALDYANKGNNKSLPTKIMSNLGILYNVFGEREKAHSYFIKSMKLSLVISNNRNYISTAINLGVSYLKTGSFNNSKSVLEKSVEMSKKSRLLYQLCVSLTNLADVEYELGEYEKAKDLYMESRDLSEQMELPIESSINNLGILKAELKNKKIEKYDDMFKKIISTFEESEEYSYVASAYYTLSDYNLLNDDIVLSLENIEKGIAFTEKSKSEEDILKLKRKQLELMYITEHFESAYLIFDELNEIATKSNNYYELSKLYLSRYLYLDKKLNDTEFLLKAQELSSYFDYCYLTKAIQTEISLVDKK